MGNFKDRRSTGGKLALEKEPTVTATAGAPIGARPHRVAPDVRTADQFFKNLDRPMTRGDYLKVHAMNEYHRQQQVWWRRAWRWLNQLPPIADINSRAANAHAFQLAAILVQMQIEADAARARNEEV